MTALHDHIANLLADADDPLDDETEHDASMMWIYEKLAAALCADPTLRAIISLATEYRDEQWVPPEVRALLADWRNHAE